MSDAGESGVENTAGTNTNFINVALAGNNSLWKVCTWHRNQKNLQAGGKGNEVGFAPYEACRQHGAIIVNGHEHSYSRTKNLVDMVTQAVDTTVTSDASVKVAPGSTFVIVAGMGGQCCRTGNPTAGYWAAVRTSTSATKGANGALFITFNVGGDPKKATAYYKSTSGTILDEFTITAP